MLTPKLLGEKLALKKTSSNCMLELLSNCQTNFLSSLCVMTPWIQDKGNPFSFGRLNGSQGWEF